MCGAQRPCDGGSGRGRQWHEHHRVSFRPYTRPRSRVARGNAVWLACKDHGEEASRQMAARGNIMRETKHSNHSCPVEMASPHRWKNPSMPTWMQCKMRAYSPNVEPLDQCW